jgi:hypothetical protein
MNQKNNLVWNGIFIFFSICMNFSCKDDDPIPVPTPTNSLSIGVGDGIFITNEGNYLGGNAKVSFYKFSDGTASEDLFNSTNGRPLGDVCQSMTLINGKEYIVVNNSGKIEVCNPNNFLSISTITGFTSPRYILPVSSSKAYVSDYASNSISVVNLVNNTRTGSFSFPGSSEAMVLVGNDVFVSSTNRDKVYVINSITDLLVDSISVAMGGNSLQIDSNGNLWVLCYGDYFTSSPGGLYRINTITHGVELSLPFTSTESPTKLCANNAGDTLYYLNYSVYRFPITSLVLPTLPFIAATTQSFYGLGIRPLNGEVYVTDAMDYAQRGKLLRYTPSGNLLDTELVGIIPGGIYFY